MDASPPLVLLIRPVAATDAHEKLLARAGFSVRTSLNDRMCEADVLAIAPALIAVELQADRSSDALDFARRLRGHPRTRLIPVVLYAAHLERDEIEHPAHTGILWLQVGPADGLKLVAAIRGVLAPSTT
jgi:CheY-like chemotaxis protein